MAKKCIGCGVEMQNTNSEELGYAPNLDFDYCARCFKLKNYGQDIKPDVEISNEDIIKLYKKNALKLFLTDFLNVSEEVLDVYKNLRGRKILIISKADLIPENIHEQRYLSNIRKTYDIHEDIYLESSKNDIHELLDIVSQEEEVYVCGFTISGKSTLINKMTGSKIVESKHETTTLDVIKTMYNNTCIYDTPGLAYKHYYKGVDYLRKIRPSSRIMKENQELVIHDFVVKSNVENNFVLYIPGYLKLIKRNSEKSWPTRVNIPENSDLLIKGVGFINIKNSCILETDLDANLLEVRDSLVGRRY